MDSLNLTILFIVIIAGVVFFYPLFKSRQRSALVDESFVDNAELDDFRGKFSKVLKYLLVVLVLMISQLTMHFTVTEYLQETYTVIIVIAVILLLLV